MSSRLKQFAAAAATFALGGCAVLVVDVDVYKGPLSNEDDVQLEQLAVLAVGAKPLLIQLRDALEAAEYDYVFRTRPWYQAEYIKPPLNPTAIDFFRSTPAQRVNSILGLYHDRPSGAYAAVVADAVAAFREYESLRSVVDFNDDDVRSEAEWRAFYRRSLTDDDRTVLRRFFGPPEGDARVRNARGLAAAANAGDEDVVDAVKSDSNAAFSALADAGGAAKAAGWALAPDAPASAKAAFVDRTRRIAVAFADSRGALRRVWRAALTFRALTDARDAEEDPEVRRIVEIACGVAARLTHPGLLAYAIGVDRSADRFTDESLRQGSPFLEAARDAASARDPRRYAEFNRILSQRLCAPGSTLAVDLLALDERLSQLPAAPAGRESTSEAIARRTVQKHGVVGANLETDGEHVAAARERLREDVAAIASAFGFQRGRLDLGLYRVIEDYLKANYVGGSAPESIDEPRARLVAELVRFAEKLRVVASFQVLLGAEAGGGADAAERRTDARDPSPHAAGGDLGRAAQYVDVLEAIANSIITQADHFYAQRRMRKQDDRNRFEENAGLKAGGNASSPLDTGSTACPADVLDTVIAKLRYEAIEAARSGDVERLKNVRAAIGLAASYRSPMVKLRPASAYLRNAYPASSLTRDSLMQWKNMLGDHMQRLLPFVGENLENGDGGGVARDIDKQYWQNINRVRLSGGGTTNYVVAKDDVGNWYVKGYDTDVRKIIKSAASLASFAAGGAVNAGAVARAAGAETPDGPLPPPETPPTPDLRPQADAVEARLAKRLREIDDGIRERAGAAGLRKAALGALDEVEGIGSPEARGPAIKRLAAAASSEKHAPLQAFDAATSDATADLERTLRRISRNGTLLTEAISDDRIAEALKAAAPVPADVAKANTAEEIKLARHAVAAHVDGVVAAALAEWERALREASSTLTVLSP
ncbi:MAG TPA: hypothetical protein VEI02_04090 [Planctomycetota bacterium]|nr:hypothetical protein [Planctomycetota bacterium]